MILLLLLLTILFILFLSNYQDTCTSLVSNICTNFVYLEILKIQKVQLSLLSFPLWYTTYVQKQNSFNLVNFGSIFFTVLQSTN